MTAKGIPVFNTPGANANAVKELVVCSLLLASRGVMEGHIHVNDTINVEEGADYDKVQRHTRMPDWRASPSPSPSHWHSAFRMTVQTSHSSLYGKETLYRKETHACRLRASPISLPLAQRISYGGANMGHLSVHVKKAIT